MKDMMVTHNCLIFATAFLKSVHDAQAGSPGPPFKIEQARLLAQLQDYQDLVFNPLLQRKASDLI